METESHQVVFGKSIIVPSVRELVKEPITKVPPRMCTISRTFRWRRCRRRRRHLASIGSGHRSPLLASWGLHGFELERLHSACKDWGFFQVVNHGVSSSLLEEFKGEVQDFFELPLEEKKKLWQQPDNHEGFGQLFVVSEEQRLDWSDMFYLTTLPFNLRKSDIFQKLPQKLGLNFSQNKILPCWQIDLIFYLYFTGRETLEAYSVEMKKLAMTILSQMTKALKMKAEEIRDMFSDGVQSMRMNYYPPCPEPDMTIGFAPHSDADALTILFQLNDTEGLQIRKEGRWVPVKPLPNAFVVNIGDIMEIVSNGIYQSIEHRAMVNSAKKRLSVATFFSSNLDSELGPAPSLISPQNPAIFQRVPIEKYFKDFFARRLDGKSYLKFMKIDEDGGHTS
ncbi:Protein SRG1 [Vitis vinifera]|uniref:Protein SRG1 n=1 Tax=Vitis vinifera TaxID=29760 RepID=A0A438JPD1_VITVI|nr:Protein SRG1 [Vitis vinifera]